MLENGNHPPDLSVLPMLNGDNETSDAWGRPLKYSVDDQGIITLKSLGRDGKRGGEGEDADIIEQ